MDSGASLNMMSKNDLTFGGKDTIRRSKELTIIATARGKAESVEEYSVHIRSRCHFHKDVVGRFTGSTISGFIMRRRVLRMEKGNYPSLIEDGIVMRSMSENHVQFQKNPENPMTLRSRRTTVCTLQVPAHHKTGREKFFNPMSKAWRTQGRHRATDCISQVSRHGETGRIRFQKDFNLSKKDSLLNHPRLPQGRGGTTHS